MLVYEKDNLLSCIKSFSSCEDDDKHATNFLRLNVLKKILSLSRLLLLSGKSVIIRMLFYAQTFLHKDYLCKFSCKFFANNLICYSSLHFIIIACLSLGHVFLFYHPHLFFLYLFALEFGREFESYIFSSETAKSKFILLKSNLDSLFDYQQFNVDYHHLLVLIINTSNYLHFMKSIFLWPLFIL